MAPCCTVAQKVRHHSGLFWLRHRDPIALLQAEAIAERVGDAVGGVDEGREAVGAVAVDEERLVVAAHGPHLGHRPQRRHPLGVHLHRSAEDLLGDHLEHPPGARELGLAPRQQSAWPGTVSPQLVAAYLGCLLSEICG